MHIKKQIFGTSIFVISDLLIKLGNFIILPILTRLLSQNDYGVIVTYTPIISLFSTVIISGLYIYQSKLYTSKIEIEKFKSIIFTFNLYIFLIGILTIVLIVSPFGIIIRKFFDVSNSNLEFLIIWFFIIGLITALNNMAINFYQLHLKFLRISAVTLISFIISNLLAIYLIVVLNFTINAMIIGSLVNVGIIFLFIYFPYMKNFKFKIEISSLKEALIISSPMILTSLLGNIINYSDRFIIANALGMSSVAVYSIGVSASSIIVVVINSFTLSWRSYLYNKFIKINESVNELIKLLRIYNKLLVLIGIIGMVFSKEIFAFVFPDDYSNSYMSFIIISIGLIFHSIYHFNVLYFQFNNKNKYTTYISVFAAIINIVINILFINKYGIIIAAISTTISYISVFIISEIIMQKKYSFKFIEYKNLLTNTILLIPNIIFFAFPNLFINLLFIKFIYLICVIIYYIFTFKRELREAYILLKH